MVNIETAHPDWLEREDMPTERWDVSRGSAFRGEAWTNIDERRMRVPFGADEASRAVRSHEMMHAKISPSSLIVPQDFETCVSPDLVAACEEVRVNTALADVGFNLDALCDGSETRAATMLTSMGNIEGLTNLVVAVHGTKISSAVMRAIKKQSGASKRPDIYAYCKDVNKLCRTSVKHWRMDDGHRSTAPYGVDVNVGFDEDEGENIYEEMTVPKGYIKSLTLAKRIANNMRNSMALMEQTKSDPTDEWANNPPPLAKGSKHGFAPPIIDKLPLPERTAGRLGRKRIATDIGANPRRINRLLTDPERRIFDRRARGQGGVVLIDQSGSMRLDTDDIWSIIKAAPGCTVIGYSHEPGSVGKPNIWVLAEGGRVVRQVRPGNVGNGVDGPALLFALGKRKKGDPFIWVCDGQVTDSNDDSHADLNRYCASFVRKHGVHMVPDVARAVEALKKVSAGQTLPTKLQGPISW